MRIYMYDQKNSSMVKSMQSLELLEVHHDSLFIDIRVLAYLH